MTFGIVLQKTKDMESGAIVFANESHGVFLLKTGNPWGGKNMGAGKFFPSGEE